MSDLMKLFLPTEHVYNLMSNGNLLCLPRYRTTSYYNSFIQSRIKLWNELEIDIKNSPTLPIFKAKLKKMKIPKTKQHFNFGIDEKILFFVNHGIKLVI